MKYFHNKEIGKIIGLVDGGTILEFDEIASEDAETHEPKIEDEKASHPGARRRQSPGGQYRPRSQHREDCETRIAH